jgi:DNA-binding beta-propeller fold protein YncE
VFHVIPSQRRKKTQRQSRQIARILEELASLRFVVANILVGVRPRSAVFTKDSKAVYATAKISGEVVRVDMQKNTIVERIALGSEDDNIKPKDILLSPDEVTLYVAAGRANKVMVLEINSLKLKTRSRSVSACEGSRSRATGAGCIPQRR